MAARPSQAILLVDDDPTNLQLLRATLARTGAKLVLARSGEEALEAARAAHPSLVLLDVMMPGIDGFETCRRLKADPALADAAVIFLSALDDARDKVQGLSVGAVDYIAKPFQPQEVLARVQTHLTIQRLRAELGERNRQLAAANQQILESVAEGIVGFDSDGRISFANPAACQLTGLAESSLLGQGRYGRDLLLGADGVPVPERATPVYASLVRGETVQSDTLLLRRGMAAPLPVALTSAPIRRGETVQGAVLALSLIHI
jgi:DNA-binding response OmpR family regulator